MQTTRRSLLHGLWLKWSALIHGALRLQFLTYCQGWSIGIVRGTCLQIGQGRRHFWGLLVNQI
ncbi:hypothetical protein Godav_023210 [Gossypium davidsonii]|uniref:Uncharacterized protein n=1 Tax=Gossypium davidsonii TaxID=34287 RepID=A0A7J8SR03_GOSDV|nr:hypothetical protein [Gossypium davidsonii]